MFDVTSRITYKSVPRVYKSLTRVAEDIPVCVVGNKIDQPEHKVETKKIVFPGKENLMYYDISVCSNF